MPPADPAAADNPEERLWHASIRQAVELAAGGAAPFGLKGEAVERLRAEARAWLFAERNPQRADVCAGLGVMEEFLLDSARRAIAAAAEREAA